MAAVGAAHLAHTEPRLEARPAIFEELIPVPQPPANSHLSRAIEMIDRKTEERYERNSTLWDIAAVVATIGIAVICGAAFVGTAIISPYLTSLVAIGIVYLFPFDFIDGLFDRGEKARRMAEIARVIHSIVIPNNHNAIRLSFVTQGIDPHIDYIEYQNNLVLLKPLIAVFNYWNAEKTRLSAQSEGQRLQAQYTLGASTEVNESFEREMQLSTEAGFSALEAKVRAAFAYGALCHPHRTRSFEEQVQFVKMPLDKRTLYGLANHPLSSRFVTINTGLETRHLSYEDVRTMEIPQLATQVFGV